MGTTAGQQHASAPGRPAAEQLQEPFRQIEQQRLHQHRALQQRLERHKGWIAQLGQVPGGKRFDLQLRTGHQRDAHVLVAHQQLTGCVAGGAGSFRRG
jgi:hypothetical protein